MSRFAKCQFNGSGRAYTYETNGHDCAIGDKVTVATPRGETMIVEVIDLTDEEPPFACKPILGKVRRFEVGERVTWRRFDLAGNQYTAHGTVEFADAHTVAVRPDGEAGCDTTSHSELKIEENENAR